MIVMANELKTRGVTAIDEALKNEDEVIISVRGKSKYVVMDLEAALIETRRDIESGRAKTQSAQEHIKAISSLSLKVMNAGFGSF